MQQSGQMPMQCHLVQAATEYIQHILTHLVKFKVQVLLRWLILQHVSLQVFNVAHVQQTCVY